MLIGVVGGYEDWSLKAMDFIVAKVVLFIRLFTTGNHVVLFTYKQVNDRVTHTTMRMNLTLDFRVFSYSVYSTD